VLEAAGRVTGSSYGDTSAQDTLRFAIGKNWLPQADAQDAISLDRLSLLIMRAFALRGGPMYSLFHNAHYSYREMVYKDLIQGRSDPSMTVSGYTMLLIVNRLLYYIEDNPWDMSGQTDVPPPAAAPPETAKTEENIALVQEISAQIESLDIANTDVRITDEGVTISVSNIQFSANSTGLPDKEKQTVEEIARILKSVPGRKILVAGHTALAGNQRERLRISRERAQAVADYLVALGARAAGEIVVRGYGAERPIADNKTQKGMELNRRVEITLLEN